MLPVRAAFSHIPLVHALLDDIEMASKHVQVGSGMFPPALHQDHVEQSRIHARAEGNGRHGTRGGSSAVSAAVSFQCGSGTGRGGQGLSDVDSVIMHQDHEAEDAKGRREVTGGVGGESVKHSVDKLRLGVGVGDMKRKVQRDDRAIRRLPSPLRLIDEYQPVTVEAEVRTRTCLTCAFALSSSCSFSLLQYLSLPPSIPTSSSFNTYLFLLQYLPPPPSIPTSSSSSTPSPSYAPGPIQISFCNSLQ